MNIQNNQRINFQAGLTKQFQAEIKHCEPQKISDIFAQNNIATDFKNNKTIAWCSYKCLEILKHLNKQFNLNLGMPTGIFVEDFNKFNKSHQDAVGLCCFEPTNIFNNSLTLAPAKTIFFNQYTNQNYKKGNIFWENLDSFSDKECKNITGTNFFLDIFLHEFSHVIHGEHLSKNLGKTNFIALLHSFVSNNNNTFKSRYNNLLSKNCCNYAATHPMEAVACDMSKRICESLNTQTLLPDSNFIQNSPYRDLSILKKALNTFTEDKYNKAIRHFWNGDFK